MSTTPPDSGADEPRLIAGDDPLAVKATEVVQSGDVDELRRLLADHPWLATARIGDDDMSRTLLHAATDWPGHFPNNVETVRVLVDAGAGVNARFHGGHVETPLHWAASSDDVEVIDALLDAGADIEADGAVLGGGSPLADAVGFAQWNAARRLVERGATTRLGDAAGLGMIDRMAELFAAPEPPVPDHVTASLWSACNGNQQEAAEFLIDRGADINWIGWDGLTPLDVAVRGNHDSLANWLRSRGAKRVAEIAGAATPEQSGTEQSTEPDASSSGAVTTATCSCCGESRFEHDVTRLNCTPEVALCASCVAWLAGQVGSSLVRVVPVLPTHDVDASAEFWTKAGFSIHRINDEFAVAERDGEQVHLVLASPPARERGAAYFLVRDPDALHESFRSAALPVADVRDEPWGMREFTVQDPGGNLIRIGASR